MNIQRYERAFKTLRAVILLVMGYSITMIAAGNAVAAPLFDILGFGPTSKQLDPPCVEYALFMFGVLGAVIFGWMFLVRSCLNFCRLEFPRGVRSQARSGIATSLSVWFLLDTGFSIVIAEYNHAAFNIPFFALMMGPLFLMHTSDNEAAKQQ